MEFFLIGAGMGSETMLTAQAREAIEQADHVLAPRRVADGLAGVRDDIEATELARLADRALECEGKVAVLLSGDTGFFSAAKTLYGKLRHHGRVHVLPGMSSLQVFCAKLGASYDDAVLLSVHGREGKIIGPVSYNRKVIVLTGGQFKADALCMRLLTAGLRNVRVCVGENLGSPDERIVSGSPEELARMTFGDLCIMMIINDYPVDPSRPLRDSDLIRGDVPMTKQSVRWLACDLLSVRPDDIVYDIGAGTGSVSMDLARRARRGRVFAVECDEEALRLIESNRIHTGSYHVTVIDAMAPRGLDNLPAPDCAFIGGSRGSLPEIIAALRAKNPAVRIVITAIALETLHTAVAVLRDSGCTVDISCVNVTRARAVNGYHMMLAQNPVYLIGGNL